MSTAKIVLPEWCEGCNEERFFVVADPQESHLLRCSTCGTTSSAVWCTQCGMGGAFVSDLEARPSHWKCPDCKRTYDLPVHFFDAPIPLQPAEAIPPEFKPQLSRRPSRSPGLAKRVGTALQILSRPTAWFLLFAFAALLAIHFTTIVTGSYFFPFPEAFFIIAMIAVYVGMVPSDERISTRDYYRTYLHPIHPLLRWLPFLLAIYSIALYLSLGGITAGERLIDLLPEERRMAEYRQALCIQGFLMAAILMGGLVRWHRGNTRAR